MAHQYPPNYSQDAYYAYGRDGHEFPPPQGYPGNGGGGFYPPDAGNAYPPPPPPHSGRTVPPLYIPTPSRTPSPGYPQPPYPPHSSSSPHPPSPHQQHPYGPPSPHQHPSPHQQHSYGPPSPHQHPSPRQQHPYGPPSPHQQHPYGPPSPSPSPHQQHPYGPPSPSPHQQHSHQHSYQHQHQHSHSSHSSTHQLHTPKQTNGPEPGLPTMNPSSSSPSTPRPEPGLPTMHPEKLSSRPTHRPASFGMTAPSYVNKNKHRLSSGRRRKDDGCNDCFSVCGCIRCTCTFCILLLAALFLVVGITLFGFSKTIPSRCPDLCNIGGGGRFTNSTSDNFLNRDTNSTSDIANGDINESSNIGASSSDGGGQQLQRRFDGGILYVRNDILGHYNVVTLERRQAFGDDDDDDNDDNDDNDDDDDDDNGFYRDEENPVGGRINDAENKCTGLCSSVVYNAMRYTGIGLLCLGGFMLACTLLTLFCRAAKSGGRGSGCLFCC